MFETYQNIKSYCDCVDYEIDKHTYTISKKEKEPMDKNTFTLELSKYNFIAIRCLYGENTRTYNILSNGYKPQYIYTHLKCPKYEPAKDKKKIAYIIFINSIIFTTGHDIINKLFNLVSDYNRILFVIDTMKNISGKLINLMEGNNISCISLYVFKCGPLVPKGAPITVRKILEKDIPKYQKKEIYPTMSYTDAIAAYYGFEKKDIIELVYFNINCSGYESVIRVVE